MASVGDFPFTDMDAARVAVDAPVSTDLMTDLAVNDNYLKNTLTGGATADQDINARGLTVATNGITVTLGGVLVSAGGIDVTGDADLRNNAHVFGNLQVDGIFTISELVYLLAAM